jgi:hypothetical protein
MRTLLLLWALLPALAVAQDAGAPEFRSVVEKPTAAPVLPAVPLEVRQTPLTYLIADAASIVESDGRVLIFTENLSPERRYGMSLTVSGQPVDYIEVHPEKNPFPPEVLEPMESGGFLIEGRPGDVFFVSIRADGALPTWEKVVIEGPDPDDPGDPGDPGDPDPDPDLTALSKRLADAVGDPPTRAALKAGLQKVVDSLVEQCKAGSCPTLSASKAAIVAQVEAVLGARTGDSRFSDWKNGWRLPIGEALKDASGDSAVAYVNAMRAAISGL